MGINALNEIHEFMISSYVIKKWKTLTTIIAAKFKESTQWLKVSQYIFLLLYYKLLTLYTTIERN